jgi:hypothetical protein
MNQTQNQVNSPGQSGQDTPGELARGATISTAYVGRQVKAYAVFDSEVSTLSTLNAISTVCVGLTSGFMSLALGILANAAFAERETPAGSIMVKFVVPALFVLALIAFLIAIMAIRHRRESWKAVQTESKSSANKPS